MGGDNLNPNHFYILSFTLKQNLNADEMHDSLYPLHTSPPDIQNIQRQNNQIVLFYKLLNNKALEARMFRLEHSFISFIYQYHISIVVVVAHGHLAITGI